MSKCGPNGGVCPLGVAGGAQGLQISSSAFEVKGVGVAPAQILWGNSLEVKAWLLVPLEPESLPKPPGEGMGLELGEGLGMPGEPTAKGEAADGKGLPSEAGLLTGEGAMNPGLGVGCCGAGEGCRIFGAGGLCRKEMKWKSA